MSRSPSQMAETLGGMGRMKELRQRLLFVFVCLIIYRVGTFIPVPGVDPQALLSFMNSQEGTIIDVFNLFTGGALERMSLFALGVMPYISASIIMQLMSSAVPQLQQLKKEGSSGRQKITQYTRIFTVVLAAFQSGSMAIALQSQGNVVYAPGFGFIFTAVVSFTAGTMFLMWLGEQISERGVGNGISLIIFAGIVAGLPRAIAGTLELVNTGQLSIPAVIDHFRQVFAAFRIQDANVINTTTERVLGDGQVTVVIAGFQIAEVVIVMGGGPLIGIQEHFLGRVQGTFLARIDRILAAIGIAAVIPVAPPEIGYG